MILRSETFLPGRESNWSLCVRCPRRSPPNSPFLHFQIPAG